MKFIFGIFLAALMALAIAGEFINGVEPENPTIFTETDKKEKYILSKRELVLTTYATPVPAIRFAASAVVTPYVYTHRTYAPVYTYPAYYY